MTLLSKNETKPKAYVLLWERSSYCAPARINRAYFLCLGTAALPTDPSKDILTCSWKKVDGETAGSLTQILHDLRSAGRSFLSVAQQERHGEAA